MSRYFFDSYPIIEIIMGNENFERFRDVKIVTTVLNIMEVYYFLLRRYNMETADYWVKKLDVELINIIRQEVVVEAAKMKFKYKKEKLSFVDCVGYIIANKYHMKFLTGDEKFKKKENVEFVKS